MQSTIQLTANAAYGHGGEQYIARITGRDSKFTFAREFVGRKSGKRGDHAEYDTDEPGLYLECDVDKNGDKDETYYLVYSLEGVGLTTIRPTKEEMMDLARRLDAGQLDWTKEALTLRLKWAEAANQDEEIEIKVAQLGHPSGKVVRREWVKVLRAALNPEASVTERPEVDVARRALAVLTAQERSALMAELS